MKAVVAAFNQEKALVGALSVITNLRMELFEALVCSVPTHLLHTRGKYVSIKRSIRIVTIIYFVTKQIFSLNSCKAPIKTLLAIRAVVFCPLETMDGSLTLVLFMFGICSLPPCPPQHRELQPLAVLPHWKEMGSAASLHRARASHYSQISLIFYPVLTFLTPPRVQAAGGWRGRR